MALPVVAGAPAEVFVSYSPADERWATWIAVQLERERYRVLMEAWDREPGEDVDAFVRRAAQTAALTVVVMSQTFRRSRAGVVWASVMGQRRAEVVVVRVDEAAEQPRIDAALDLGPVTDEAAARAALLARIGAAPVAPVPAWAAQPDGIARRFPVPSAPFPPAYAAEQERSSSVTVLHVAGPRFTSPTGGAGPEVAAGELRDEIVGAVDGLCAGGKVPRPDLLVVSGDLMASGRRTQKERAEGFLTGLRVRLGLTPDRLVIVPGAGDVSPDLCRAYIDRCLAEEREPQRPYFEKLTYFAQLFGLLYGELPDPGFVAGQPWTLVELPELRLVVAGLNSTMAISHRPEDDYGLIGEKQAGYFAGKLKRYEDMGWLRLGVVRHDPAPASGSEDDPTALRDADLLLRVLGGRLNLLLHGPGPAGDAMAERGTLQILPAAAPGRFDLVQLTADGLTRYSPEDPDGNHWPVDWPGAAATFAPVRRPDEPRTMEILEPVLDPQRRLLRRIEEVVRARYGSVTVKQADRDPPHLLIIHHEDQVTERRKVGAHVGELTAEVVDDFLPFVEKDRAELVYEADRPPSLALQQHARRGGVLLKSFIEFQGMVDLSGYVAGQLARLQADGRYPPNLYVPQRYRDRNGHTSPPRENLDVELMRLLTADEGCFAVVLGDFGRGKSFVLREVTRRITEQERHVVPVLVDLRAVDKASDVRGLLAAHLASHGEGVINFKAFEYMVREGRIVLLFDGFDELVARLTYDRAVEHLRILAAAAQDKAKIVVACRTQHFSSHQQVFDALAEQAGDRTNWRVLEIERFTKKEVRDYLRNRYGDQERADARLELMSRVGAGELVELAQNPRMLSFVADLDAAQLRAAASESRVLSAARMFERILTAWLEHEVERTAGQPGAPVTLLLDELWHAVETLAMQLWRTGERQIRLAELDEVAGALTDLGGWRLSAEQTTHAVGSGSLLVRTEEDLFGFIHRSVSDWLVARVIARELAAGNPRPPDLAAALLSEPAIDFLCDLAPVQASLAWAETVEGSVGDSTGTERRNAEAVAGRLHAPPGADLRGASLVDEELSFRRFDGVDLTGADLSGARLVGANLRGAVLRGARLVGAQLDEAQLDGADLTGADLGMASLVRTDLSGAVIDGSSWRRAAVVHGRGVPAEATELRGAAIAPGMPVHTEFAPAGVGVRYGFNGEHGRLPQVVAYSPAGDLVAIGNQDGGVLICDTATGRPVRTLTGHQGRVFAVAYGDEVLVSGSRDGTVRVWDACTGAVVHVLDGHAEWTWPLLLDPASGAVITGDAASVLRVWDLATGRVRHALPAGRGTVYSAVRCGEVIAACYRDGGVLLWDVERGTCVEELACPPGPVYRVAASPSGELLAAAGCHGAVTVWQLSTGRRWDLVGHGPDERVFALAFHPDRPLLVSGGSAGTVLHWDTTDGSLVHRCGQHATAVYGMAFSARGDLVTGERAGTLLVRDGATGVVRATLVGHTGSVWPFVFRPDGDQLAVSDDQFTLRLWDPRTGRCDHELSGHAREVTAVRFNADGSSLAISRNDGMVRIWDPRAGRLRARLPDSEHALERLGQATFAPSGNRLATITNGRQLNIWDLDAGRVERNLDIESTPVWAVAFSPSGKILATADDDDAVRLWYSPTGRLLHTLRPHRGRVRSIAFSADGELVATGCDDCVVRLWDARSGALYREFAGHEGRVWAVDFGDGCLASASWDTTARIWKLADGTSRPLVGHTGSLWTATFTPDGRTLATAGDDRVIRLWDVSAGREAHCLGGHTGRVWSLAFSPDGRQLASGGVDGTTRLWSMGAQPTHRLTLLGLPGGWAAVAPDGRYKLDGTVGEAFWHVVGMRRFDVGELDDHLPEVTRLTGDLPF